MQNKEEMEGGKKRRRRKIGARSEETGEERGKRKEKADDGYGLGLVPHFGPQVPPQRCSTVCSEPDYHG